MLKREKAAELLTHEQSPNVLQNRLVRVAALDGAARQVAYAILERDETGQPAPVTQTNGYNDRFHLQWQGLRDLNDLTREVRQEVFTALFPKLGPYLEAGWQLLGRLPYPTGWQRKSFRAPGYRTAYIGVRTNWLHGLLGSLSGYCDQDIEWVAQWAAYLSYYPQQIGLLLGAAIDQGGPTSQAVFEILRASATGDHPVGAMGRHITTALLVADEPRGWEFIEKLLLAAQREEGLRQTILETIDEAQPQAFRRMLRLILDHNLTRFSATVRAVDVWFGFGWEADNSRAVANTLDQLLGLLDDPAKRAAALVNGDGQAVYLALWAIAFEDALTAIQAAHALVEDTNVERRFGAVRLLAQLGLKEVWPLLLTALEDSDLRVATLAFDGLKGRDTPDQDDDLFERLERLLVRVQTTKTEAAPLVWPWALSNLKPSTIADELLKCRGTRPVERLLPYLADMTEWGRVQVAQQLVQTDPDSVQTRQVLLKLVNDRSSYVSDHALKLLDKPGTLSEAEARLLENLLNRYSKNVPRAVLTLLLKQTDEACLNSARRLLAATKFKSLKKQAGLELLQQLVRTRRAVESSRELATAFHQQYADKLTTDEKTLLQQILEGDLGTAPTIANVLGLIDPAQLTPTVAPRKLEFQLDTPAARACLAALDELALAHQETPVSVKTWQGMEEMLLGNINRYHYHYWLPTSYKGVPVESELERWPLREVWQTWEVNRPVQLRDPDGLELLRALLLLFSLTRLLETQQTGELVTVGANQDVAVASADTSEAAPQSFIPSMHDDPLTFYEYMAQEGDDVDWNVMMSQFQPGLGLPVSPQTKERLNRLKPKVSQRPQVEMVLRWFMRTLLPPPGALDLVLTSIEYTLADISPERLTKRNRYQQLVWRENPQLGNFRGVFNQLAIWHRASVEPRHNNWQWRLEHWIDQPFADAPRQPPDLELILKAYENGVTNRADILERLVGWAREDQHWYRQPQEWRELTSHKPSPLTETYPVLKELIPQLRERILAVELARGELTTAASPLAKGLIWSGGVEVFIRVLKVLGDRSVARHYNSLDKDGVLSHLLRASLPEGKLTSAEFNRQVGAAELKSVHLVEASVFAPQWAALVERYLEWPALAEAIWWTHAHTKDNRWTVEREVRELWIAQIAEYTPLSAQDLLEGAVDVAWFGQFYGALGAKHWETVYASAKYAANGIGHERARLFSDAMTGRVSQEELLGRIKAKRNQDAVRALGLLPLPDGPAREDEILARYRAIQEFLRTGRQFGAQRRASEDLASRIGLDNLARTAGYADPLRLRWAMEAKLAADLKDGPLTATVGEVSLSLAINPIGEPTLTFTKAGKSLKALPASAKKDPQAAALVARRRELEQQLSRMRLSLEAVMCRGDLFRVAELKELLTHPLLARLLRGLVFIEVSEGQREAALGYPELVEERFFWLRSHDGTIKGLSPEQTLRLAHPYDLLKSGVWSDWQHECFQSERIQPFKQIFRELYVLTESEVTGEGGTTSSRYSGHQVQPKQVTALLGQRGWVTHPQDGTRRTFHQEGLTAWLESLDGTFTPLEVEGLTLDKVYFTRKGDWRPLPLAEIEPRIFSEVMRDLDMVVSVAHAGGVDPEASQSTVEMRASLVRETSQLLGLGNVSRKSAHVLIEGELGRYSVHLGSAIVHRQPGGALCIVPVHSQQRGRLFLPFADNDPKTAEVLSKVILLAQDKTIKDPTVLSQIL